MRKRILAGLLTVALALSLLPIQALASTGVAGVANVYTLADIKAATKDSSVNTIRLMNDIDASKEAYEFDEPQRFDAPVFCRSDIRQGVVFDGNGHTIYNLKSGLWRFNSGTIRNLNISIHDTESDSKHLSDFGAGTSGIEYFGVVRDNQGVIENCNVTMQIDLTVSYEPQIGGIALFNADPYNVNNGKVGVIRDCIANLNINIDTTGARETSLISGISRSSNDALIDHCLVLGSFTTSTSSSFNGLTNLDDKETRCVDSAFAMEKVAYPSVSSFSPGFGRYGHPENAENCRVANDLSITSGTLQYTVQMAGPGGYTLDTRENILKDWDLSGVPGETPSNGGTTTDPKPSMPEPEPGPAPAPKPDVTPSTEPSTDADRIEFHFEGNCGDTRSWKFDYDDQYFYSQDDGYGYNAKLSKASLCLEMSAFSTSQNELWYEQLSKNDLRRAENISALYKSLGFETDSCQFVNYDVPLTDTSDKVAYSMAMKYITNEDGGTDTLIAVPIRGGGYGGEWKSNFHVAKEFYSPWENHYGFDKPASDVLNSLSSYVANHEIKGDLKIWAVGYSRGAAVANLLGRKLNHAVLGGIKPNVCDIYVYTFATPAGATLASVDETIDPNIYNIVSPVDLVPHLAPSAWKYTRYGTTLLLPTDNTSKMWNTYSKISALEAPNKGFPASQRTAIDHFCDKAFTLYPSDSKLAVRYSVFDDILYLTIQQQVMDFAAKETSVPSSNFLKDLFSDETMRLLLGTAVVEHFPTAAGAFNNRDGIGNAHYPEHYLARLEADNLQSEDDFLNAVRSTRSVILYPSADKQLKTCDINVEFWKDSSSRAAGSSAGSYRNGVCTSGEVSVEMTDIGLIATFPAGADYTFTVSGADAGKLAMSIYAYDDMELDPARTMDFNSLPSTNGSPCTVYVPEDPYDEFYAEDANGKEYVPDSDSEYPDRVDSPAFTDVPADAYFYDAVEWAVEEGITSGTSSTTFSPNNGCTRAQMVTFLWRAAGCPEPESDYGPFRDVPKDAYYRKAVLWAAGEGITSGTSPTTFSPNATVTRAQTVTFLWRWEGEPEADQRSGFRDVPTGQYYSQAVSWAVEAGITNGTGTTTFSPGQTCTRAQIVTFLWRDMA